MPSVRRPTPPVAEQDKCLICYCTIAFHCKLHAKNPHSKVTIANGPQMKITKTSRLSSLLLILLQLNACVVSPLQQGHRKQQLNGCPPLPNCVSTEASSFMHRIESFELKVAMPDAWPIVKQTVSELPRVTIQHEYPGYIYAKSHSKIFKFIDYLEVLAVPNQQHLMVRSSSMLGISDLGVNKKRTEALRARLKANDIIE